MDAADGCVASKAIKVDDGLMKAPAIPQPHVQRDSNELDLSAIEQSSSQPATQPLTGSNSSQGEDTDDENASQEANKVM